MKTTLKDFIKENGFNQYGETYGLNDLQGEDITHEENPNWVSEKKQYVEVTSNDTFELDDKLSKENGILNVSIETAKKARVYYNDKILKEVDVLDLVNKKNKSIKESKSNTLVKGSPEWHKVQIAKKTLKMSDIGANMMGGMTKAEAREILKKHNIDIKESIVNESSQDEDRLTEYFNKLVGPSGPAETKEGELVRAMNKIIYRYFNDGDYFFKDYGIETCGTCAIFLMQQNIPGLQRALNNASNIEPESNKEYTDNDEYDKYLSEASKIICDYIDSKNGEYSPNNDDCLNYRKQAMDKWDTYDWEDIDEANKFSKSVKVKHGKMHKMLGLGKDEDITTVYKSGKKLYDDLMKATGNKEKEVVGMLAYAANLQPQNNVFDKALHYAKANNESVSNQSSGYTEEEVRKLVWEARNFYHDYKDLPFNKLRPLFYDWFNKNK